MFNRFDILEAWHLFLSNYHTGQGSEKYARLSQLRAYFKPRPNLRFVTLSDNAKRIYCDLMREEIDLPDEDHIVDEWGKQWYDMRVGTGGHYADHVFIRASYFGDALEALQDWCDHPDRIGYFTGVTEKDVLEEVASDYKAYAEDCINDGDWDDEIIQTAREDAESDLAMVGHTTLEHWNYKTDGMPGLANWGGVECDPELSYILTEMCDEEDEEDDE